MNSQTRKKYPAIVLAGGHKNIRWHDLANLITDMFRYHEHYLSMGKYKTLRRLPGTIDGQPGSYAVVLYVLNTLRQSPRVGDIYLVGPAAELESSLKLAPFATDNIHLIDQGDTFGENAFKGYTAAENDGHALLIMGDSPLTSTKCVNHFVEVAEQNLTADVILPVVKESVLDELARFMPRPYLRVLPAGLEPRNYVEPGDLDNRGRVGVRLTSLALADLSGTTASDIDHLRSLRKMLRPAVQKSLRQELNSNILIQYRRGISVDWVAEQFQRMYHNTIQVVGLYHGGTAIDVDSSSDLETVARILKYRRQKRRGNSGRC